MFVIFFWWLFKFFFRKGIGNGFCGDESEDKRIIRLKKRVFMDILIVEF